MQQQQHSAGQPLGVDTAAEEANQATLLVMLLL
jgi:hypothetical protein